MKTSSIDIKRTLLTPKVYQIKTQQQESTLTDISSHAASIKTAFLCESDDANN